MIRGETGFTDHLLNQFNEILLLSGAWHSGPAHASILKDKQALFLIYLHLLNLLILIIYTF